MGVDLYFLVQVIHQVPVPTPVMKEVIINEPYPVVKEFPHYVPVTVDRIVERHVPRDVHITVTQQVFSMFSLRTERGENMPFIFIHL